jgi:SAM-dependent methyltransferase
LSASFESAEIAAGYAAARPAVHPRVCRRVAQALGWTPRGTAIDIGCGAGLSTRALECLASVRIGFDPSPAMAALASGGAFLVARAEQMPFAAGSADLLCAAGALNYVDLDRFWPEAARVLAPEGALLVYDFSPGKVGAWFEKFIERYPWPPGDALALDPETLAARARGFRVQAAQRFTENFVMSQAAYIEYMMTETNVAYAVRRGIPAAEIRKWCQKSLAEIWGAGARSVSINGYFVVLQPRE